ncbi:MAG: amino acid ABC transporter substrate-binding protein [Chloroflexi bacterium]|nr:amino acid ABC transporter substrate-binding protein [Chloroflexota bacterium]
MNKLALLTFLLLFSAACRPSDDSWERVQAAGVLKVGLDPTYPPFEVADANGVSGLDVDLAQALAADLGVEVEFVYFGFDGLYDALATEQVDVLLSALVIAPERGKDFAFSEPYFNAGQVLIAPANDEEITEMADLNGRTLAVELGALGHVEATTWAKRIPDLTVRPYTTGDEALTAVLTSEADAALIDAISGRLFLKEQPQLRIAQEVTVEPFALIVRIEDEQLLTRLNASLEKLRQSGELDAIIGKWLSVNSER